MPIICNRKYWFLQFLLATTLEYCLLNETSATTTRPTSVTAGAQLSCYSQNLTSTVVLYGSPSTFPRVINNQAVKWQVLPSSDEFNSILSITNYDDQVNPSYAGVYTVNRSSLGITKATIGPEGSNDYSTAGMYILKYLNPNCTTAANLIVIQKGPTCACNVSDTNTATLTCSVTYAESNIQPSYPIFTWKNSRGERLGENQPVPTQSEYVGLNMSTFEVPINVSDAESYVCLMKFSTPTRKIIDYMSSAAPTFESTCSVSNSLQRKTTASTKPGTTTSEIKDSCLFNDFDDCLYNTSFGGAVCGKCLAEKKLCEAGVPVHLSCDAFCKRCNPESTGSCENSDQRRCPCLFQNYKACFCVTKELHPDSDQQKP